MAIDYGKDYTIKDLKKLSLWEFYQLCLVDEVTWETKTTAITVENTRRLVHRENEHKYLLSWIADPCTPYTKLHKVWDKDYCEMVEKLPDAIVKKLYEDFINE